MDPSRRSFIKESAIAAAAIGVAPTVKAAGANGKLVVGQIGCGNRSKTLVPAVNTLKNVELAYVCDPDSDRAAATAKLAGGAKIVGDLRKVLDDKSVDAVLIATPDHWHAPAALLAMEAGKHVYLEKPCSHTLREGRLLIDAAQRLKRVIQHGTQARSSQAFQSVMQMLREGIIGDVKVAKAWNIQRRKSIGYGKPGDPPSELDYNMWIGPAEMVPFQANRLHYNWHWWHDFGCGGIGNDGIHHVDYARWGLGMKGLPTRISANGGKYFFEDDQQFPDTQQVAFEYSDGDKKRMLVYEQRLWAVTYPHNVDSGAEFYGTEGEMFVTNRGKFRILGRRNRRIERKLPDDIKPSVPVHQQNWIDCIRDGGRPTGDIETAHETAAVVHLGNIASRVGRTLEFDPVKEEIVGDAEANALLSGKYRKEGHWAAPKYA
jgi:predicted dehydrogenase